MPVHRCGIRAVAGWPVVWEDDDWRLKAAPPSGSPLVLLLEPRRHVDVGDLPDHVAADPPRGARRERGVRRGTSGRASGRRLTGVPRSAGPAARDARARAPPRLGSRPVVTFGR
ncbi:MAG: hypothetical protein ACRCSN_08665 [Dermatophilaceae bacterium]